MSDQTENQINSTTVTSTPQSDDDYIEHVYQTALGRSSDHDGKAHWLEELHAGHISRNSLMDAFNNSAEGHAHAAASMTNAASPAAGSTTVATSAPTTGSTTATTSVAQSDDDYLEYVYQTALGRSSDHDGKAHWLDELHAGHIDRNSLMDAFNNSAEGHAHLTLTGVAPVTQVGLM